MSSKNKSINTTGQTKTKDKLIVEKKGKDKKMFENVEWVVEKAPSCSTCLSESWTRESVSIEGLDLVIGSKTLISKSSFKINTTDRIVLLGQNGCGKTTLFNWISDHPSSSSLSIYQVAQELPSTNKSITDTVLSAHIECGKLYERQSELESKEDMNETELKEYEEIGTKLDSMGADSHHSTVKKILHGLGFPKESLENPLNTFSGGWRARVALAQGLFMKPDLLLLDEPTNHLDLEGVLWLTNYLETWPKAFIVISHNIGFVREIANTIWLIERSMLKMYRCNYYRFQEQHNLEIKKMTEDWDKFEKAVLAIKKKGTPASKIEYEEKMKDGEKKGIVRPLKNYAPKFFFMDTHTHHIGSLMNTSETELGYGDKVILKDVTFALYEGTRVALVGGNGSGKSTFLKFLAGELEPFDGHVEKRRDLRVVKFEQHFYHTLPEDKTPLEYIQGMNSATKLEQIRAILGSSGLEGSAHSRPIGTLSGGQKARVYFASIVTQNPDILLMDEPTNHLDVETIEGLTTGLKTFKGAAIIVSHDLNFLEDVATEVWQTTNERLIQLSTDIEGLDKYVANVVKEMEY